MNYYGGELIKNKLISIIICKIKNENGIIYINYYEEIRRGL